MSRERASRFVQLLLDVIVATVASNDIQTMR